MQPNTPSLCHAVIKQAILSENYATLDSYDYLIFWKDDSLHYQGCNKKFAELHNAKVNDLITLNDYNLNWQSDGHDAEFFRANDRYVMQHQPIINEYETIVLPNQPKLELLTSKFPLKSHRNQCIGIYGISVTVKIEHQSLLYKNHNITPQEQRVLQFYLRGYTAKDMANELSISTRTVEFHIASIKQKTQCANKKQLIERLEYYKMIDFNL